MMEEIEEGIFKRIVSVCQDDWNNYAFFDNFQAPSFWSQKSKTMLDSLLAFSNKNNSTDTLIEEM